MKIRCQNCGTMIDTDSETKCKKCGNFYDRNIFREEQSGIRNTNCNNPLHTSGYTRTVEYKNGQVITNCEYYEGDEAKAEWDRITESQKKGKKLITTIIIVFFAIQFLIPVIIAVVGFILSLSINENSGFVEMLEDEFTVPSTVNVVSEVTETDLDINEYRTR